MGRVTAPYAVKGWIRVQPYTAALDGLLDYANWWLGHDEGASTWRQYQVVTARIHGQSLLAQLAGVEDRTAAEALKGLQVAVNRAEFPPAETDEYYWDDLIGLEVVNTQGVLLGKVVGLMETGAHDVLRVAHAEGERLIPFVSAYVQAVDQAARRILVEWDPGWDRD